MAVYKRRTFIINPSFQYRFSLFVCCFVLLTTLMYPFIILDLFDRIIELNPSEHNAQYRTELLTIIGISQAVFFFIIFSFSIFISHKIAGPMYKLTSLLQGLRNGEEFTPIFFRNGDYFKDVAHEVNSTISYFIEKRDDDFKYLDELSLYIANLSLVVPEDKKPVLNEIQSNLSKIQSRHKQNLTD